MYINIFIVIIFKTEVDRRTKKLADKLTVI